MAVYVLDSDSRLWVNAGGRWLLLEEDGQLLPAAPAEEPTPPCPVVVDVKNAKNARFTVSLLMGDAAYVLDF